MARGRVKTGASRPAAQLVIILYYHHARNGKTDTARNGDRRAARVYHSSGQHHENRDKLHSASNEKLGGRPLGSEAVNECFDVTAQ